MQAEGVEDVRRTYRLARQDHADFNLAYIAPDSAIAGLGIALLPSPVCIAEIQAGRLARVLREHRDQGATVYATFPNRKHIPRAVSVFVDFVSEKLRLASGSWRLE